MSESKVPFPKYTDIHRELRSLQSAAVSLMFTFIVPGINPENSYYVTNFIHGKFCVTILRAHPCQNLCASTALTEESFLSNNFHLRIISRDT